MKKITISRQKQILTSAYDYAFQVLLGAKHLSREYMLKLALMGAPAMPTATAALATTAVAATSILFTNCSSPDVDPEVKPGGGTTDPTPVYQVKEQASAPAQSLTIFDAYTASIYNLSGQPEAFDVNISSRPEDNGVAVTTTYSINNSPQQQQLNDNNIKSFSQKKNGYVIQLESADFQIKMTSKNDEPLLKDVKNNIGYKSFNTQSLMWEKIEVPNAVNEDAATNTANQFLQNLKNGNSKITSATSGVNDKNKIVVAGNTLTLTAN